MQKSNSCQKVMRPLAVSDLLNQQPAELIDTKGPLNKSANANKLAKNRNNLALGSLVPAPLSPKKAARQANAATNYSANSTKDSN